MVLLGLLLSEMAPEVAGMALEAGQHIIPIANLLGAALMVTTLAQDLSSSILLSTAMIALLLEQCQAAMAK